VRSQNVSHGAGGPKKPKLSFRGSVSGCGGAASGGGHAVGLQHPLPC
jgi:hypothetical protein